MRLRQNFIPLIGTVIMIALTANPAEAQWCYSGARLTSIERAICSDQGLIDKDTELNRLYKQLGGRRNARLKAGQRNWLRNRNGCTNMDCLHAYYDSRLVVLRTMAYGDRTPVAPPPPPVAVAPPPTPPPPVVMRPERPASPNSYPSGSAQGSNESGTIEELEKLPEIKPF